MILEVVTGSSFKDLFQTPRIREAFVSPSKYQLTTPEYLGLIVVAGKIDNVKKHGVEVGLPEELFDFPEQKIFPVLIRHFDRVIPVLLVSILGSRATATGRWA